jgi:MOSC domain-containing protein YiiM
MSNATIRAIHVGRPAELQYNKRRVLSAINKQPVTGPVMVRRLNVEGDEQADLKVHGGANKAVYCYPSEHYAAWAKELGRTLEFGFFGENLTVSGLLEESVCIGDVLSVGGAVLQVTQPRMPCFKLGAKFGDQRFVGIFLKSGRSGFYCRVLQEGLIESGEPIAVVRAGSDHLTIAESISDVIGPTRQPRSVSSPVR